MDLQAMEEASEAEEHARQQARQSLVDEYTSRLSSRGAKRLQHIETGSPIPRKYETTWKVRARPTSDFFLWIALSAFVITFAIPTLWILHNRHWPRSWYGHLPTFPEAFGRFTQARLINVRDATLRIQRFIKLIVFIIGRVFWVIGVIAITWLVSICRRACAWTFQCIHRVTRPLRLWFTEFNLALIRYHNRIVYDEDAWPGWVRFLEVCVGRLLKVLFWSAVATMVLVILSYYGQTITKQLTPHSSSEAGFEMQWPASTATGSNFPAERSEHSSRHMHWPGYLRSALVGPSRVMSMFAQATRTSTTPTRSALMTKGWDNDVSRETLTLYQNTKAGSFENKYKRPNEFTTTAALRSGNRSIRQDQEISTSSISQQSTSPWDESVVSRTSPNTQLRSAASKSTRTSRPERATTLSSGQGKRNPLEGTDTSDMSLADLEQLTGPLRFVTVGYKQRRLRNDQRSYCSLCKQRHAYEVMIAEMGYRYDWQM